MSYYSAAKVIMTIGTVLTIGGIGMYTESLTNTDAEQTNTPSRLENIEEGLKDMYRKAFGAKF